MLRHLTALEQETFERLCRLLAPKSRFTLVGGAACREYGLSRPVKDLDFVVNNFRDATNLLLNSRDFTLFGKPDPTWRTCTQKDVRTDVLVDFITGGIRITDNAVLGQVIYSDPVPIPQPSGFVATGQLVALNLATIAVMSSRCS